MDILFIAISGLLLGAGGGYLYWKKVGCLNGTCHIRSSKWGNMIYGAAIGLFLGQQAAAAWLPPVVEKKKASHVEWVDKISFHKKTLIPGALPLFVGDSLPQECTPIHDSLITPQAEVILLHARNPAECRPWIKKLEQAGVPWIYILQEPYQR